MGKVDTDTSDNTVCGRMSRGETPKLDYVLQLGSEFAEKECIIKGRG